MTTIYTEKLSMKTRQLMTKVGLGLSLGLALLFQLLLARPAYAQGPHDQYIFGNNHTIGPNETVKGSVYVAGGNLKVDETATVEGDLIVFGGNVTVDGRVSGDVFVFGGNIRLNAKAVIEGDAAVFGGNLSRAEGARILGDVAGAGGEVYGDGEREGLGAPGFQFEPQPPAAPGLFGRMVGFAFDTFWNIVLLTGLALLAWLVAAFLPEQMQTVGDTVSQAPLVSLAMGLITLLLAGILFLPMLLLVFTICLAIIPLGVYTLLGVAGLLGWLVIGQIVGERLLLSLDRPLPSFVVSSVVGVVVLTVLSRMPIIEIVPIIGPFFSLLGGLFGGLIALTGLGAVMLTRYGTRPYSGGGLATIHKPTTAPATGGLAPTDFNREEQAEAELKARIKAALAEADQEPPAEPKTPPTGEATKEPES
jgi:hypothetical protein